MTGAAYAGVRARLRRAVTAVGVSAGLALPMALLAPAPAQAAGLPGTCPDANGVTVVVDFQALGGGVLVRCAPGPLPGAGTGLDALVAAGIPLEGVRRWGDSFICRLEGKPALTTSLAVTGKPDYHEQCVDTPPAAAFWGYWSAPNGGSWQYSNQGVKSHRAVPGGFEGWSFSLNASGSSNPAPRLTPTRKPVATPTTQAPAAGAGSAPGPGGSGASTPTASGGAAGAPGSPATATPGTRPPSAGGTPSPGATSSAPSATPDAAVTPATDVPTDAPVVSGELASAPAAASGPSTGTVAGVGVLAFLLVAGLGTAWRRRRGADSS